MDIKTIKALIKIAKANLKVARMEFKEIYDSQGKQEEHEWEDALDEAGRESYACEQVVRFLVGNLEIIKNKSNN
jgi:hypothetical protein